jgi:hypothetical protein
MGPIHPKLNCVKNLHEKLNCVCSCAYDYGG